jgi:protein-S-isoprenylcysteine O-methyltransferase Ste14
VPSAADAVIVAAWLVVLGDNLILAARGVQHTTDARRYALGAVLVVALLAAGIVLERASGGRLAASPVVVALGMLATVAGALLHVSARRVIGAAWSTRPDEPTRLVEDGPYAIVRHPLYLGLALLGTGSMAAHPSLPTIAGGLGLLIGLGSKVVREERAMASTFGSRWEAYRRRVPPLIPHLRRRS